MRRLREKDSVLLKGSARARSTLLSGAAPPRGSSLSPEPSRGLRELRSSKPRNPRWSSNGSYASEPGNLHRQTETFDRVIRLYRRREMARIALRDLTSAGSAEDHRSGVVASRRHIAERGRPVLDRALTERFGSPLGARFGVIAMGKHGSAGAELLRQTSTCSFILDADENVPPGGTRRDQGDCGRAGVIKSLSASTQFGHVFRVDANLRPSVVTASSCRQ